MAHKTVCVLPDSRRSDPVPYVLSAVCRQEALSVRPFLQSPGTAVRLTAGAFLLRSASADGERRDRGEQTSQTGKEGKKTQGKNILYKSSTVNVWSADADQPMSVLICDNMRKPHNAPLIISFNSQGTARTEALLFKADTSAVIDVSLIPKAETIR